MEKQQKQALINEVTQIFKNRQWFNGAGFPEETLIIAYNYYPAFELKDIKEALLKYGVQFELKDIRNILPNSNRDDVPNYIR
jgi:hypothetical protein